MKNQSPSLKDILHRWAKRWQVESDAYADWEYYLDGKSTVSDSLTGYSERTLMALLTRAWPFGPGSPLGYLPLIAEFPVIQTPAKRKRKGKKRKRGGARIPDLWFATYRGDAGVLVEGKVAWVAPDGVKRKQSWVDAKRAAPKWKWGTPKDLATVATKQLKKAYGPADAGQARGVVALFVNVQVPVTRDAVDEAKPGDWWQSFSDKVEEELEKLVRGTRDHAIVKWSCDDWGKLNKDTSTWNEREKKRKRKPYNFFHPVGWLLLYRATNRKSAQ
jgi:hypothetical protein